MSAGMAAMLVVAILMLVVAVAALLALLTAPLVAALYALRHRHPRIMRAWWWCGYRGLYRIDWKRQWLRYRRDPVVRCEVGHWHQRDDGLWAGWRCSKVKCHWLGHRRVREVVREPW